MNAVVTQYVKHQICLKDYSCLSPLRADKVLFAARRTSVSKELKYPTVSVLY